MSGRGPGKGPLAIAARRCEECGQLYHPSGCRQKYCLRPSCLERRGEHVADFLVKEP